MNTNTPITAPSARYKARAERYEELLQEWIKQDTRVWWRGEEATPYCDECGEEGDRGMPGDTIMHHSDCLYGRTLQALGGDT